jgi:DNA-binding NtrC family response regulator
MAKAKLLLIDDEAALLRLMQTYLGRLDYDVQTCAECAEAMRIVKSDLSGIELAIVDLSLMKGQESLIELADANPNVRLLVCSGLPFEVEALPARLRPRFGFLQKPFLPKMLVSAVEELLQRNLGNRAAR